MPLRIISIRRRSQQMFKMFTEWSLLRWIYTYISIVRGNYIYNNFNLIFYQNIYLKYWRDSKESTNFLFCKLNPEACLEKD